jgi:hypothetical protein
MSYIQAEFDKGGNYKSAKVDKVEYVEALKNAGFYRYDIEGGYKFVFIQKNRIKILDGPQKIADHFLENMIQDTEISHKGEAGDEKYKISSKTIKKIFYNNLGTFFGENLLCRLVPDKTIRINTDTAEAKYFYYQNGYISINKEGAELKEYKSLKKMIFTDNILDREYMTAQGSGMFENFIKNICSPLVNDVYTFDRDRFNSIKTIIGYLLHGDHSGGQRAVIFTDSKLTANGEANGGTGKTLIGKAIGEMLNATRQGRIYVEINGKDFDPTKETKYNGAAINTALIHLNDVRNYFDFRHLYNDITEGITVKHLYENPFTVRTKIMISTNQTIKINDPSSRRRAIQFELSDYYNETRTPETEFGAWFFRDWDFLEWSRFDNFMISCVIEYLNNGINEPKQINLDIRNLYDHTSEEFVNFMIDNLHEFYKFPDQELEKKEFYNSFTEQNEDYKKDRRFTQKKFTKWIRFFADRYTYNDQKIKVQERRSGGKDYIKLILE